MGEVLQCDICGDVYQRVGVAKRFARVEVPFRYRLWMTVPGNRDKIGFVKQDICRECRQEFEEAVRVLKERESDAT